MVFGSPCRRRDVERKDILTGHDGGVPGCEVAVEMSGKSFRVCSSNITYRNTMHKAGPCCTRQRGGNSPGALRGMPSVCSAPGRSSGGCAILSMRFARSGLQGAGVPVQGRRMSHRMSSFQQLKRCPSSQMRCALSPPKAHPTVRPSCPSKAMCRSQLC